MSGGRKPVRAAARRWLAIAAAILVALPAVALPPSVFVVHCEPTRANPVMWAALTDLVALAEGYRIPLSIDFTAQWASMILKDEAKVHAVETWLAAGHEIGCHHHGYWATKERNSTWDGYTNTPLSDVDPQDRARFLGTMDDYMAILNALPGERTSGCFGGSAAADAVDHPCRIVYSTRGQALEDAVSQPVTEIVGDCTIREIGHALLVSQEKDALNDLYLTTADEYVFGVVGHAYNFADFPEAFEAWFAFLNSVDPCGETRTTVSELIANWTSPS